MPKSLTKKQNAVRAFRGALRGALHPPLDGYGSSCNAAESVLPPGWVHSIRSQIDALPPAHFSERRVRREPSLEELRNEIVSLEERACACVTGVHILRTRPGRWIRQLQLRRLSTWRIRFRVASFPISHCSRG